MLCVFSRARARARVSNQIVKSLARKWSTLLHLRVTFGNFVSKIWNPYGAVGTWQQLQIILMRARALEHTEGQNRVELVRSRRR